VERFQDSGLPFRVSEGGENRLCRSKFRVWGFKIRIQGLGGSKKDLFDR